MEVLQSQLKRKLSEALAASGFPPAGDVSPATDPRFGDYQSNAALVLGKKRGENPRKIADAIVSRLDVAEICEQPNVAGAGFINFTLKREAVEKKIAEMLHDERLGVASATSPRKIVVDFGSPNVAKPMHVGHIRSTFLGDASRASRNSSATTLFATITSAIGGRSSAWSSGVGKICSIWNL